MTEHGGVAGAGLKPYVDDVHLFAELCFAAAGASRPRRKDCSSFKLVPSIRAFAGEQVDHGAVRFFRFQKLAAVCAEKDGDGYAPNALARDAPVGPCGDHVAN